MTLAHVIDETLTAVLDQVRSGAVDPPTVEVLAPLTRGEFVERLAICHCRLWALEDRVRDPHLGDAERGQLVQRILDLNSTLRPTLVRSIDALFLAACRGQTPLALAPAKLYAGRPAAAETSTPDLPAATAPLGSAAHP